LTSSPAPRKVIQRSLLRRRCEDEMGGRRSLHASSKEGW
jgi:hypothetical protein